MRFYGSPIVKALRRNAAQQQPLYEPILPVEVIERIFALACEEDGAVARSLSVVCKAAHSVAKYAARFDTVTLRSGTEREVRRCVSLLSEARAASATHRDWVARPVVRHLCVLITPVDAWRLMYDNLRKPCHTQATRATDETLAIRDSLNNAIQVLFLQVAPDLETLCVLRIPGDWYDRSRLPSDIDTIRYGRGFGGFPKLRDVLFDGNLEFKPSQDGSGTGDDSEAGGGRNPHGSLFPALRRMHIAPCWSPNIRPFDRWMDEAPALESLRFTMSFSMTSGERECPTLPLWVVQFGSLMSQALCRFGGTRSPEPTGSIARSFPNMKEVVVVITRSLVAPDHRDRTHHLGLAQRVVKRLTKTPKAKPDPRSTSLSVYPTTSRDDCFDATEQYLDRDWRERVTDPAGDGIDLYEFSRAFRRNVTVYRTNVES